MSYLPEREVRLLKLFMDQNMEAIKKGTLDKLQMYRNPKRRDGKVVTHTVQTERGPVEFGLSHSVVFDTTGPTPRAFVLYKTLGRGGFGKGKRGEFVNFENPGAPGVRGVAKVQHIGTDSGYTAAQRRKIFKRERKGQKKVGGLLGSAVREKSSAGPIGYIFVEDGGQELFHYVKNNLSSLGIPDFVNFALSGASDLRKRFHDKNIIHRDVKLENMVIDEHGNVRNIDIATWINLDRAKKRGKVKIVNGVEYYNPKFPKHRMDDVGTQQLWSPEVESDRMFSKKSDIYALGINFLRVLDSIKYSEEMKEIATKFKQLCNRMMARNPAEHPDIGEVVNELKKMAQEIKEMHFYGYYYYQRIPTTLQEAAETVAYLIRLSNRTSSIEDKAKINAFKERILLQFPKIKEKLTGKQEITYADVNYRLKQLMEGKEISFERLQNAIKFFREKDYHKAIAELGFKDFSKEKFEYFVNTLFILDIIEIKKLKEMFNKEYSRLEFEKQRIQSLKDIFNKANSYPEKLLKEIPISTMKTQINNILNEESPFNFKMAKIKMIINETKKQYKKGDAKKFLDSIEAQLNKLAAMDEKYAVESISQERPIESKREEDTGVAVDTWNNFISSLRDKMNLMKEAPYKNRCLELLVFCLNQNHLSAVNQLDSLVSASADPQFFYKVVLTLDKFNKPISDEFLLAHFSNQLNNNDIEQFKKDAFFINFEDPSYHGMVLSLIRIAQNKQQVDIVNWFKVKLEQKVNNTPLICAVNEGYVEGVKALIEAKAYLSSTNDMGETPLMFAATKGYTEIVDLLIKAGADVSAHDIKGKKSALLLAVANEHVNVVKQLIAAGADVSFQSPHSKKTALLLAVQNDNVEIVKALLAAGASISAVNSNMETPLIIAAEMGNKEIVELLLKAGASLDAKNKAGETPLQIAQKFGNSEIKEMLMKARLTTAVHVLEDIDQKKKEEIKETGKAVPVTFGSATGKTQDATQLVPVKPPTESRKDKPTA